MDFEAFIRQAIFFSILGSLLGIVIGYWMKSREQKKELRRFNKEDHKPDEIEMLKVMRHKPTGKLLINLEGKPLPAGKNLDGEQTENMDQVLSAVYSWMGREPISQVAAPLQGQESVQNSPAPVSPSNIVEPESGDDAHTITPFADSLPPQPSLRDANKLRVRFSPSTPITVPIQKPMSIVEQIDAIFQKTVTDPGIIEKKVKLIENPGKGMHIHVLGQIYESIDEVPDADVAAAIRKAAKQWNDEQQIKMRGMR